MNRTSLIGILAVIVVVAAGWGYLSQQKGPAASEATQMATSSTQTSNSNGDYEYENSGTLDSFVSPSGEYAVMFDLKDQRAFRIVETSSKKVLSDYKPKTGSAIICEMRCYPFAEWLGNTTLIIGSYSLTNNAWGSTNPAKRYEAVVFDISTETYRPATQSEVAQFDLFNDPNLYWE